MCSRSQQNLEFGHLKLLFLSGGRQRNLLNYITHMERDCFASLNLYFMESASMELLK